MFSVIDVWEENGACPFVWKPEIYKGNKADYVKGLNKSYEEMDCECGESWKMICVMFSSMEDAINYADPDDGTYYYDFTGGE